jgi:hypothetical protein
VARTRTLPAIRVSDQERATIAENARSQGMGISAYLRELGLAGGSTPRPSAAAANRAAAAVDAGGAPAIDDVPPERPYQRSRHDPPVVDVALPNAIQLSTRTGLPKATCQGLLDRHQVRWRSRPESSDVVLEVRQRGEWVIFE